MKKPSSFEPLGAIVHAEDVFGVSCTSKRIRSGLSATGLVQPKFPPGYVLGDAHLTSLNDDALDRMRRGNPPTASP
jgi:hypothetical protein